MTGGGAVEGGMLESLGSDPLSVAVSPPFHLCRCPIAAAADASGYSTGVIRCS